MTKQTITFAAEKLRAMNIGGIDCYIGGIVQALATHGVGAFYRGHAWHLHGAGAIEMVKNTDGSATFYVETPDAPAPGEPITDTQRLDWLLPIVGGDDDDLSNRRTILLTTCLLKNLAGREAIDAAMTADAQPAPVLL